MLSTSDGSLRVAGVSHRSLDLRGLARVIPGADETDRLHALLRESGVPHVLLVTCNRLECYWQGERDEPDVTLRAWVTSRLPADATPPLRTSRGAPALQHLVRVASGLESMMVGDRDVLGQVRGAWLAAREAGVTTSRLDRVFERVIHGARRVLQVCDPADVTQSIGRAAVDAISERLAGAWRDTTVAVVGSGAAATSALSALRPLAPRRCLVTGRTPARVAQVAAREGATAIAWSERDALLREADVTLFAVRADAPLVVAADATRLLDGRAPGSVIWADLGMPPNVEAAARADALQLLTLPSLMAAAALAPSEAVLRTVERELVYLHAALHVREAADRPVLARA